MKKIGARPGDEGVRGFTLPEHTEQSLTPEEAAEAIARKFSVVSKEYDPLDIHTLSNRGQNKILSESASLDAPKLSVEEVLKGFKRRKTKMSSIPGDIPPMIKKNSYQKWMLQLLISLMP